LCATYLLDVQRESILLSYSGPSNKTLPRTTLTVAAASAWLASRTMTVPLCPRTDARQLKAENEQLMNQPGAASASK